MAVFSSTTLKYHCHSSFITTRAGSKIPRGFINQHPETQHTKRSARLDDTDFEPYKASTLTPHQLTAYAVPVRHRYPFWIYRKFQTSFLPIASP